MVEETAYLCWPNTLQPSQTDYSLILYCSDDVYDKKMHYPWIFDIYVSITYHIEVYYMKYWTLGHTHHGIIITIEKFEYDSPKKGLELKRNFTLNLPNIHTKKSFRNRNMVRWNRYSVKLTHLGRSYDKIHLYESLNGTTK